MEGYERMKNLPGTCREEGGRAVCTWTCNKEPE